MTTMNPSMTPQMQQCIDMCGECHSTCETAIDHCLRATDRADMSHLRTLMDCADICRMTADLMLRGSAMSGQMCGMCADICTRCADACRQISGDQTMQDCADTCMRCAEMCRSMAQAAS